MMGYIIENKKLIIMRYNSLEKIFVQIYFGKCPSINEFRKITKLLGIDGK